MAEGLEEESKKSLQMEAELEKQLADFDTERQQMRGQLTKKEERWGIHLSWKLLQYYITLTGKTAILHTSYYPFLLKLIST